MSRCGCGSACKCGSGCGGCKTYPDMSFTENATSETIVFGVAPEKGKFEKSEMDFGRENGGCKCGDKCTCDPCNCK